MYSCIILDVWREPEYPEKTLACTGKSCRFPTDKPQPGFKPGTL